jgi:hypothetical protein
MEQYCPPDGVFSSGSLKILPLYISTDSAQIFAYKVADQKGVLVKKQFLVTLVYFLGNESFILKILKLMVRPFFMYQELSTSLLIFLPEYCHCRRPYPVNDC